jgi:hypothetical protein
MNPWKNIYNEFKALMDEEDRIVQQRVPQECGYAYVTYKDPGEFNAWVEGIASESLLARLELLATEAGIALGCPPGILPHTHWFHSLFLDLRANNSDLLRGSSRRRVRSNRSKIARCGRFPMRIWMC